jgi:uncharacterized protein
LSKNEISLSWQDFEKYANNIIDDVCIKKQTYEIIIGVARGGIFLAGYLAYHLNIKEIDIVNVQSYQGKKMIDPKIINLPNKINSKKVLLVDDILDSGNTFRILEKWLEKTEIIYHKAVLIDKCKTTIGPEYVGAQIQNDCWVVYPWEKH